MLEPKRDPPIWSGLIDLTLVPPQDDLYNRATNSLARKGIIGRFKHYSIAYGCPALSQSRKKAILEGVQKRRRQRAIITMVVAIVLIATIVGGIYAYIAGQNELRQVIPANLGASGGCLRPIHTHDGSGQLHVEPLVARDMTIGDFFLVWGKAFNSSGIFRSSQQLPSYLDCLPSGATPAYHDHHMLTIVFRRDAPSTISMTVNGNPEPLLQNYVFPRNPSAANIVITYGPGVPAEF